MPNADAQGRAVDANCYPFVPERQDVPRSAVVGADGVQARFARMTARIEGRGLARPNRRLEGGVAVRGFLPLLPS